ncbi:hypothetical protein AVEN_115094-1 [Araneus ventricosus]|uniref:Uncharacterized protein n=1 Tax=Araneus ventricosus TaxID=182803 RepID=A0A4Y1ZZ17_ARAVE|nr:hypothetical protein AVEN_115094-1 [Araneus ventricosus]
MYEKTPCDVTACRGEYIRAALGSERVCVDPLERLWNCFCRASWETGELSSIESAVIVDISDLLTVCVAKSQSAELLLPCGLLSFYVANLCKIYCSLLPVLRVFLRICE